MATAEPIQLAEHAEHTPGPWELCQHLKSVKTDAACSCGYRGVIYGPEHDVAMAICQPGHQPAPVGQEGTEPARYPREVEIANAHLIAAAPDLLEALELLHRDVIHFLRKDGKPLPTRGAGKALHDKVEAALAKARGKKP